MLTSSPPSPSDQRPNPILMQAASHGNKPSKGAQIDQELREEDEAAASGKGHWGSKKQ